MRALSFIKEAALNLFFPKFCLSCQKEGNYLCQDCFSTLDILEYQYCLCKKAQRLTEGDKCRFCCHKKLNGLYFATDYQNQLLKKLIHQFKYEPYVKELAEPLASLIITHFKLSSKIPQFNQGWILMPIPLSVKREKKRGFNQAKEISKELSRKINLPLVNDTLFKTKETLPQVELEEKSRMENPQGAFAVKNKEYIKDKKILLVDDVYTTGATMEEAARVLKNAGAKEV